MSTIGTPGTPSDLNVEAWKWISAQEVANHLANKLGFSIMCDFKKFGGTSPVESYVRMRVAMKDNDALMPFETTDMLSNLLRNYSKDIPFRESVKKVIEPYMYPQDPVAFKQMIVNIPTQRLQSIGLCGENLSDIYRHAVPLHDTVHKYVAVYLKPEAILKEMMIDPADDNPGIFHIDITEGDEQKGIRWYVTVTKPAASTAAVMNSDVNVTLDTIFNSASR